MGSKNPIAELVVAPRIVITVPMLTKGIDKPALTTTITMEMATFYLGDNFASFSPITSSIESLVGKVQNGVANVTTSKIAKSEM
jgi:hypothetical protein